MTENDILGFDPQSLSVFNQDETPKTQSNPLVYRTRPSESKSEDGIYRATIKIVYNPFDPKCSILDQQSYALEDENGWFQVVSSLTNNDTSCPIFKAWKQCHYADVNSPLYKMALGKDQGGYAVFDKRFARYVIVQIMEDKNNPELQGKFMIWKLPKSIYDVINSKMNPNKESGKAAIPVMDFLFGRSIDLEVTPGPGKPGDDRYARETKYMGELSEDYVSCTCPDGSPILNDEQQAILDKYVYAMSKVWKCKDPEERAELLDKVKKDANTIELSKIYNETVLPQIKQWAPNLVEVMEYKEWTPEVKERVQKWIKVVLTGNVPKNVTSTPEVLVDTPKDVPAETSNTIDPVSESTFNADTSDDLPF